MNKRHSVALIVFVVSTWLSADVGTVAQVAADLTQRMNQTLTSSVVLDALQNVIEPAVSRSGKSASDWTLLTTTLISFITKASTDVASWATPAFDTQAEDGTVERISLQDYASDLLGYIANPFSPAPAAVKAQARTALNTLSGPQVAGATNSIPGIATNAVIVIQVASTGAALNILGNGSIQAMSGASKYLPSTHIKIAEYNPSANTVVLSAGGAFFDKKTGKFSATSISAASPLFIEQIAGGSTCYLDDGSPARRMQLTGSGVAPVAFSSNGMAFTITPLKAAEYDLDTVVAPTSGADIDAALGCYAAALESARASALDFRWIVTSLAAYCQQASTLPDWNYVFSGKAVQGTSPKTYVNALLSSVLTLTQRYPGASSDVVVQIRALLASPAFGAAASFAVGSVGVFMLPNTTCLAVTSTGAVTSQVFVSPCDPKTHFKVVSFDTSTGAVQFAAQSQKVIDQSGILTCTTTGIPTNFRCVVDSMGSGFNILNAQNKALRWVSATGAASFGDTGDIAVFTQVQGTQTLLDGIAGISFAADLNIFDKALQAVKDVSVDLSFTVSALGSYIIQMKDQPAWTAPFAQSGQGSGTTGQGFAVALLNRVKNASWFFTGLTPAITEQISAILAIAQDQTGVYLAQINSLDALAAQCDLSLSSSFIVTVQGLVAGVAVSSSAARSALLSKLDTCYSSAKIAALGSASQAQKNAWNLQVFALATQVLSFPATTVELLDEKLGYIKSILNPRVMQFDTQTQAGALQDFLTTYIQPIMKEGLALNVTGVRRQKMRQIMTDLNNAVQQVASDMSSNGLSASVRSALNNVMAQVWAVSGLMSTKSSSGEAGVAVSGSQSSELAQPAGGGSPAGGVVSAGGLIMPGKLLGGSGGSVSSSQGNSFPQQNLPGVQGGGAVLGGYQI